MNPNAVEAAEILPLLMAREFLWVLRDRCSKGWGRSNEGGGGGSLPSIKGYDIDRLSALSRRGTKKLIYVAALVALSFWMRWPANDNLSSQDT